MSLKWTEPVDVEWNDRSKMAYLRRRNAARQKLYAEHQRAERTFAVYAVLIGLVVAYLMSILWGPLP